MTGQTSFRFAGRIKMFPQDFIVEEKWPDRLCTINYPREQVSFHSEEVKDYLHFTLVKRNWDTIKVLGYIAKRLHVSLKRFGVAGLKDKRAVTSQRVSVWRIGAQELARLSLPDMFVKDFAYSDDRINLGGALGNRFAVTIREIPLTKDRIAASLDAFVGYVQEGKIPNYFGSQRIGRGCDNADVGNAIVQGNLGKAVNILLEKVRPYVEKGKIEDIPDIFWVERRVLNHLRGNPNDYAGALRKIPKKLLRIFPAALQSRIFNEKLRCAILAGSVPETIEVEGSEVEKMPELRTRTIRRNSYVNVTDLSIVSIDDGTAKIRFTLGRGEYATTLISHLLEE